MVETAVCIGSPSYLRNEQFQVFSENSVNSAPDGLRGKMVSTFLNL
jgi:hypothetical protein